MARAARDLPPVTATHGGVPTASVTTASSSASEHRDLVVMATRTGVPWDPTPQGTSETTASTLGRHRSLAVCPIPWCSEAMYGQ